MAIFLILSFVVRKSKKLKSIFLALALGLGFHLMVDTLINEGMRPEGYSILYRAVNSFKIEKVVTPQDYQQYLIRRQEVNFSK